MLRGLVVVAILVAMPARAAEAQGPAKPEAAKKTRIAVLDVQYAGVGDRKTVEGLSALLASEVASRPSLVVVAGADLRALVGFERQKQLLGCTESSCIAELAGALGVAYLVSSEVSKVGTTWLLSLTLLDANKATALNRLTRKAYSDDGLVDETPHAVDELLSALPGAGPPPPRAASSRRPEPAPVYPVGPAATQIAPGFHRHDGGFLRFQLGGGAARSKASGAEISGPCGTFAVAAGFTLGENLILFGEIFDDVDTSPTFKSNGQSFSSSDVTHAIVGYGVGAAYYFMPFNGYVSLTGGVGSSSITVKNTTGGSTSFSTKDGPIGRFSVGKEWWVSQDWGLGLSLNFMAGSMKDKGTNPVTWSSTSYSVTFSATYN